jgi:hypothetical protein
MADKEKELGEKFVAMIKSGSRTAEDRRLIRDALLNGVLQHPVVRSVVSSANYDD